VSIALGKQESARPDGVPRRRVSGSARERTYATLTGMMMQR